MKPFRIVMTMVMVLMFGLGSMSIASAGDAKPQYGGEMIYAQAGEHYSLFPGRQNGSTAQDVWLYALETLVEINEDNEIIPWLAKSWSVSKDQKTFTFKLQEGAKFHDGTPFNAEAVKFVFDEAMKKVFGYAKMLEGLEKVTADDEYTVSFHFEEPFAAFLPNLAYRPMVIFSPTAYKKHGEEWMATHMVGTGPFIQDKLVKGEYVRFVRNPNYWKKGTPYLDAVKILIVPDISVRAAMLEKGEVDRVVVLNDFDVPRLSANQNINVRLVPSTRQFYVVLNHHVYPLGNPNVRKAFNYAIDKEGIVQSVFDGRGASLSKAPVISEGVVAFTDMRKPGEKTIFPYNPKKAKQFLKNAGYEDRNGDGVVENPKGKKLSLGLWTRKGVTKGDYQIAQILQAGLKDIGVEVKIRIFESAAFGAAVKLGPVDAKYDMALLSWGIPTADPDEPIMLMMYTKAWKPVGANRSFYSSEEVDRLTLLSHHETDPGKRKEYVRLWMKELMTDAPVLFLPTLNLSLGNRTYLQGGRILAVHNYPARFAWIDKAEMKKQGVKR